MALALLAIGPRQEAEHRPRALQAVFATARTLTPDFVVQSVAAGSSSSRRERTAGDVKQAPSVSAAEAPAYGAWLSTRRGRMRPLANVGCGLVETLMARCRSTLNRNPPLGLGSCRQRPTGHGSSTNNGGARQALHPGSLLGVGRPDLVRSWTAHSASPRLKAWARRLPPESTLTPRLRHGHESSANGHGQADLAHPRTGRQRTLLVHHLQRSGSTPRGHCH